MIRNNHLNISVESCLRLLSNHGVGPVKFFKRLYEYGQNIDQYIEKIDVSHIVNDCDKHQISIIPFYSSQYPKILLDSMSNPPPVLFAKGNLNLLNKSSISIVGSRLASAVGMKVAYEWAELLAKKLVIVSGLAKGIDSQVAYGAKQSIAVLASGLILNTEKSNYVLENDGLLLSEFFPRECAKISSFAMRNRIIAGLSKTTLIVESTLQSGTMRTAQIALDQKHKVFVIPGHPLDVHYAGNNKLIQSGKVSVALSVHDILSSIPHHAHVISHEPTTLEEKLYHLLSTVPMYLEEIASIMELNISVVQTIVSKLQLEKDNIHITYDGKVFLA